MKEKVFIAVLIFQYFVFSIDSFADNGEYNKGWTAFLNNNRSEARKSFEKALADPGSKADALLSLCLLDWSEYKMDDAFNRFQQFYQSSDNPYPYLYSMYTLPFMYSGKVLKSNELTFFEKIVEEPQMNGTLKAMIYQKIGEHYFNRNNNKKADELFVKMGAIRNWQVLGTFDNTSGSGFSKDWGAISKVSTTDVFKNKVGADVHWYTPTTNKPDNWYYFDYNFVIDNVIVYAQTFVNSPDDQDVYLRAGTSGSLKIWVNDAPVSSIPEERNCDLDIYGYKVKLNRGNNRILVQIGQSEITAANFMMRITDENAHPVQGLTFSSDYAVYNKADTQAANELLPFFAEEFFETKIKAQPDNFLNQILLSEVYLRNDKSYEATNVLKNIEQKASNSSFVQYRLAEAYARADNQTDYSREKENIKLDDPDSYFALEELFDEAMESEKYSDAEDICKKFKNLYGESTLTEGWDIQVASVQKRMEDVYRMAKAWYAKYPYKVEIMKLNYAIESDVFKNNKAATALVEDYCKKYYNSSALETLAKIYFEQGNTDKGLKVLKQRIESMPYAVGYYYNLASILYNMQRYKEALDVTEQALKIAPYISTVYNTRGYIYKGMKDETSAKENFKKSIYYGPTSYDSRSQLRLLDNKKEWTELFPKYNLDSLISKSPVAKDYPEDNALLVLYDNQLIYYPEGAKEYKYEIAIKILNQSGIEAWKEYGIAYYKNQKLLLDKYEVIKSNGRKVKAETDGEGTVVFTNMEINDVLHLEYRIQDYSSGPLSKHFFDQFLFQYSIPSMINRYGILTPNDKDFQYQVTNGDVKPTITDMENMKLYQWVSMDKPAVKSEPYMSPLIDVVPTLTFSSIPDWKFVGDWYKDLTSNKFNSDYVLKATHANILKGNENKSQQEKAELFYEYVLNNIIYSNVSFMQTNLIPQKASRTITTRLGDCKDVSTLFVALCRESGISANLVLLDTRNNGQNHLLLPSIEFNHCIAQLSMDNKTYYLELTDNKLPFGSALDVDLQSKILPIPYKDEVAQNKLLRMDMPFREKNIRIRKSKVSFNNNDMLVSLHSVRYGDIASASRHNNAGIGSEEQLKNMTQSVSENYNTPVKVSNLVFKNLDNLVDSVICDFDIEIKSMVQDVAGMKIFKLPWSDKINSLSDLSLESRTFPFELWSYMQEDSNEEEMEIILPKGKKLLETPKNVKLECANASYELIFDVKNPEILKVRRITQRKTPLVSLQEYADFRNFMHSVSENDNKQYGIN